jgi:hypothetical protein
MLHHMNLDAMTGADALAQADRDGYGAPMSRFGSVHVLRRIDMLLHGAPKTVEIDAPWGSRQQRSFHVGAVCTIANLGTTLWEVVQVAPTDDGSTGLTIKPHAQDSAA